MRRWPGVLGTAPITKSGAWDTAAQGGMVSVFDRTFDVPAGHSLRLVRATARSGILEWEHEEHDPEGRLVAVYESWSRGGASSDGRQGGGVGFVKWSPHGWMLHRSDASAPGRRAWASEGRASPAIHGPSSMRRIA